MIFYARGRAYEDLLAEWIRWRDREMRSGVKGRDPVSEAPVDLSLTSYADDIREIKEMLTKLFDRIDGKADK